MIGERHAHVDGGGPELVVFGGGITLAARITVEFDAFHAELGAVLHFLDRVVDAGGGQGAHANQTVGCRRAIFFAEKFVVGANAIAIEIVVLGLPQDESDLRKQNLAIDAVLNLFGQPLLRRAGAGAGFKGRHLLGEIRVGDAHAAGDADGVRFAAVDDHGIRAVGHFYSLRRALAILRLNAVAPDVGIQIDMAVAGNAFVLPCHGRRSFRTAGYAL